MNLESKTPKMPPYGFVSPLSSSFPCTVFIIDQFPFVRQSHVSHSAKILWSSQLLRNCEFLTTLNALLSFNVQYVYQQGWMARWYENVGCTDKYIQYIRPITERLIQNSCIWILVVRSRFNPQTEQKARTIRRSSEKSG